MSCLVLPTIDFSSSAKSRSRSSHKSTKHPCESKSISEKQTCEFKSIKKISKYESINNKSINNKNKLSNNKSKKTITQIKKLSESHDASENSDIEEIDINDIDIIIYEDGFPSSESSSESDENNKDNKGNEEIMYNEDIFNNPPVYDGDEPYYLFKRRWDVYMDNKINNTLRKYILEFINSLFDTEYTSLISIKKIDEKDIPASKYVVDLIKEDPNYSNLFKIRYNTNMPSPKIINSLLNKLGFSFVKVTSKKESYYRVKSGIT